MGNLTILTIYKLFSGLTTTAAKCPAFPSANHYPALNKKNIWIIVTYKLPLQKEILLKKSGQ